VQPEMLVAKIRANTFSLVRNKNLFDVIFIGDFTVLSHWLKIM